MSAHILEKASEPTSDKTLCGPATGFVGENQEARLAACIRELASLRFSIILTARWEASESEDAESRQELRSELARLRALYFGKVDEIAMVLGVEAAIKAKEEVERSVVVPRAMRPPSAPSHEQEYDGEESNDEGFGL